MKYFTFLLVVLILVKVKNNNLNSESIDITCKYLEPKIAEVPPHYQSTISSMLARILGALGFDKKREMHLSIDLNTKTVTCGFKGDNWCSSDNTIATIYPDEVYIKQYETKKEKLDYDSTTHKFYIKHNIRKSQSTINEFFIERNTGYLHGINYSLAPKTKLQTQAYISGKCKPIKRLF